MEESRWDNLHGGYGVPYDPRPALGRLDRGDESAWDELWQELHHQGAVGVASYAAVPRLISIHRERDKADWQTYALIGTIETCRHNGGGPAMPDWLAAEYQAAWDEVVSLGCRDLLRVTDETTVRSILGAVAIAKGARPMGDLILRLSGKELAAFVDGYEND
jgi:hypothetical protein